MGVDSQGPCDATVQSALHYELQRTHSRELVSSYFPLYEAAEVALYPLGGDLPCNYVVLSLIVGNQ